MAQQLLPDLQCRFFYPASNNPLAGGLVYFYVHGTTRTVDAPTYQKNMGALNTNPVVLDAMGQAQIWLDPSVVYDIVVTLPISEGGAEVLTREMVSVSSTGGGGTGLEFVTSSDSDSVHFLGNGTAIDPLSADIKISSLSLNAISITTSGITSGLYAVDYATNISDLETAVSDINTELGDKLDKVQVGAQSVVSKVTFDSGLQSDASSGLNGLTFVKTTSELNNALFYGAKGVWNTEPNMALTTGISFYVGSRSVYGEPINLQTGITFQLITDGYVYADLVITGNSFLAIQTTSPHTNGVLRIRNLVTNGYTLDLTTFSGSSLVYERIIGGGSIIGTGTVSQNYWDNTYSAPAVPSDVMTYVSNWAELVIALETTGQNDIFCNQEIFTDTATITLATTKRVYGANISSSTGKTITINGGSVFFYNTNFQGLTDTYNGDAAIYVRNLNGVSSTYSGSNAFYYEKLQGGFTGGTQTYWDNTFDAASGTTLSQIDTGAIAGFDSQTMSASAQTVAYRDFTAASVTVENFRVISPTGLGASGTGIMGALGLVTATAGGNFTIEYIAVTPIYATNTTGNIELTFTAPVTIPVSTEYALVLYMNKAGSGDIVSLIPGGGISSGSFISVGENTSGTLPVIGNSMVFYGGSPILPWMRAFA